LPNWLPRPVLGTFAEMLAVRPYPLDVTTWGPALYGAITPLFTLVGLAPRPFEEIFVEEDGVVVQLRRQLPFRPTPGILLAPARVLRLAGRYDPVGWRADPLVAEARAQARGLEARLADRRALRWEELLAVLRASLAIPQAAGELRRRYFPRAALAAALLRG